MGDEIMNNQDSATPYGATPKNAMGIELNPPARLESITDLFPGTDLTIETIVQNTGDKDLKYFVTANWQPPEGVTKNQALLLADLLSVTVRTDLEVESPTVLYEGSLRGLKKMPEQGRVLTLIKESEKVSFEIRFPENTPSLVFALDISMDLRIEAEAITD